jgi:hypothetical protein
MRNRFLIYTKILSFISLHFSSHNKVDSKTLQELMEILQKMDPIDPIKCDFALFGLGAFEKF